MRRRQFLAGGAATFAVVAGVGAMTLPERTEAAPLPRLLTDASWRAAALGPGAAADEEWLAAGAVPGAGGPWADMVREGLLDLRALTGADGAVAAGPAERWEFAWPRDSAFAAVALSATGHRAEALRILGFLADVQLDDGGFEARYLLDGGGPPDGRRRQSDGAGWALWALGTVLADQGDAAATRAELAPLHPLLEGATGFVLNATDDGRELPDPSPDYWERGERELTLGTVAPLLAGLRAAGRLEGAVGRSARAERLSTAADRLDRRLRARFRPTGYLRYADPDEPSGGVDAAVAFLMPPFMPGPVDAGVLAAFESYQREARRPAGGLAPGAGWKQDGISWTPETALVAYAAAASGRTGEAAGWLDWLNSHRTSWGSIPEKVLADGSPAGPAPLGWSAASVVLAVAALDRGAGTTAVP